MLHRARGTWAALAFGSTVTAGLVFGTVCSVDRAGLSNGDASVSSGGSGGVILTTGAGGLGSGGASGGRGGNIGSGGGGTGGGGTGGTGGQAAGGTNGTGGAANGGAGAQATGGAAATGGITGTGGAAGSGDMSGSGGAIGTGGMTSTGGQTGTGGVLGTGGVVGSGGASGTGGVVGTGGAPSTGGVSGTGGASGTGGSHPPSCSPFPAGSSFTTPTDGLLHCYWIHSTADDWTSSQSRCVSEGGTLATVLSSEENMFVLHVLLQANLFKGEGVSLGATDGKSSSDKTGDGQYAWVTGEPWSYKNWHSGQPSGSCTCQLTSSCACDHWLAIYNDGTWYDGAVSTARPYICEAVAR